MVFRFTDKLNDCYIDVEFSQKELIDILEDYAYEKLFEKQNESDENFNDIEPLEIF